MSWTDWWVWVVGGLVLAIFEVLVPAFVFLGFAIGAVLTGLIVWIGLPPAGWMGANLFRHLLVFAVLSLIAWIALRAVFGLRKGQVRIVHHDVNDN
ncbi:NfeD family protein [Acidimangrovimonas sediminis]|uniref:NfeD family protein n=1 Tax=Acidimangrovimonas sediminis TaxID=2056283 RepID=UPI000C804D6F|nr:hypothetical protein [Acidimangrovimonas sediminis]